VLGILADARLVTIHEHTVVVAHEALIRYWPRLRGWIEAGRADLLTHRRLTDAAREWDTLKRDPEALYQGARLVAADEWAVDQANHLSRLEREFLIASNERQHRERIARRRRLQLAFGGLISALAAISVVAFIAIHQGREAARQRDLAASRELAARAASIVDENPKGSLVLARRAQAIAATTQAATAVRQALLRQLSLSRPLRVMPGLTTTATFAVTNDGDTAVSIPYFLIGVRDAHEAHRDLPPSKAVTLEPGHSFTYKGSRRLAAGTYTAWPAFYDGRYWHQLGLPHTRNFSVH
jgi:hypothetical protein